MRRVLGKVGFANVMSVVAVFIALGGTAVAVTQLPKNSVGAKQLRKNAVTSAKVKDFSLRTNDFAKGVLPAAAAPGTGPAGPVGPPGPAGTDGANGTDGTNGSPGTPGEPATKLFAFVRTGGCCGGAPPLNPPQLQDSHGVTGVEIENVGRYVISFDTSMIPGGDVGNCVPSVSPGSSDAGPPPADILAFSRASGLSKDKLTVVNRTPTGEPSELNNGGGSAGFSIAVFC